MKKLSVITVTYKDPRGLEQTAQSLQKLRDSDLPWEWVVVDSSPELTSTIIETYKKLFPMTYIATTPEGIYPAMNVGIKHSLGNYIWFLNGGDRLASQEALVTVLQQMEQKSLHWCAAGVSIYRDGQFRRLQKAPQNPFWGTLGFHRICHQGVIYSKSLIANHLYFSPKYKWAADYDLHLTLHLTHAPYSKIEETLAAFDQGGASSDYKKVMKEFKLVFEDKSSSFSFARVAHYLSYYFEFTRIHLYKSVSKVISIFT